MPDFIKKSLKECEKQAVLKDNHTRVFSFNRIVKYDWNKIKYLIVGTLTPYGGRNPNNLNEGFFYCSESNWMYEFIDNSYNDGPRLQKAKEEFKKDWKSIDGIKNVLKERGVAFLDVIDEAIIVPTSSDDNDIYPFLLDYKSFKDANLDKEDLKIVTNSKNAYEALKVILGKIGKKHLLVRIGVIPQQTCRRYKKIELQQKWTRWFQEKGYYGDLENDVK